jgi:hypothetical protein
MSEDEYGSAPSEDFIGSAPSDDFMSPAVVEGASAVVGAFEIAAGAVQSIFDPSGGMATINEGTGRIGEAVEDADKAADEVWLDEATAAAVRRHAGDPTPSSMGPISKDDAERAHKQTEWVEETRRRFGEKGEPHADPWKPRVLRPGEVPPVFETERPEVID